ncbi:hypothetical protein PVAND_011798 [Polypedilum vanderplanki]|uniref:Nose resistant-to-fluoxetine protein N-terminal domain-containing protein n=1 Tax=Polypedilum vanderplanki TaxID=319348 RepID=A0A9J6CLH6_POLVA|nr:hypothetical protein PVAND_011798 [Polypedilum vanderplanki]
MEKILLQVIYLWLLLAKTQAGNIITPNAHGSSESKSLKVNYKKLFSDSPSDLDLDILNDSSEIIDDSKEIALNFDDFVSQKELSASIKDNETSFKTNGANVFKVPKTKMKKTIASKHSSIKNEPFINDFNSELLFAIKDDNLTGYDTYFHAFTHLYDHNKWNINSFSFDITKTCLKDVKKYLNDLKLSRDWALKVNDASGKYRGLFFFENSFWLGSKQYCYEINNEFANDIPSLQFFVVKISIKLEPVNKKKLRIIDVGQCLPKSCTQQDVIIIMNRDPASLILQQTLTMNNDSIKANEVKVLETRKVPGEYSIWEDLKFYIFGLTVLALLSLIICATVYEEILKARGLLNINNEIYDDVNKKDKNTTSGYCENNNNKYEMSYINNNINNKSNIEECKTNKNHQQDFLKLGLLSKMLLCFAFGSNSKAILSGKNSNEDSLTCIHGLRLFTLLWTILVHTYLQMFGIGENRFSRNISERTFLYQLVGNATFSVDTFFFISGLLIVLLFLKTEKNQNRKCSNDEDNIQKNDNVLSTDRFWIKSSQKMVMLVLYRFLRLTPAYFFIMVLTELLMKVTYNQSVFTPGLIDHINCNKYFLRNIFYINNFYPLNEMCMMWSWYLANDFQFYIITLLILFISIRYFKVSLISTIFLLLMSWIITIYMSLHYKYTHKVSDPFESFDFLYDKPWQRFGPYVMGMFTGYFLHRVKVPPKIPFAINFALWSMSSFILFIIIFGVGEGQLNMMATSFYVSFGHTAWGFALIWITLSCCWDLAKPINSLLSFNGFFPFSRLCFCSYLIHPTVMMVTSFQSDGPVQLRHGLIFTAFLGNAAISFILAFIISLMVEAPVIRLLKVFYRK